MKRFKDRILEVLFGLGLVGVVATLAYAIAFTPTPLALPTETGEWSQYQQQIFDVARLKVGFTTATAGGSASAATVTTTTAAGAITWPANLTIVSNATATLTITTNKAQLGDYGNCSIDSNGAAGGSVVSAASVQVTAGQLVCVITNTTATSPAYTPKVYYLIVTQGNPN